MKKKLILLVICETISIWGLMACSNDEDTEEQNSKITAEQLYDANFDCIDVKTHDIVMNSNTEGTVKITVQLPDYGSLYKDAYASENPDQYLLKALESAKYDIREYEITAKVTVDDGKKVIHTDEAVQELLEQELSDAINTLMEEE